MAYPSDERLSDVRFRPFASRSPPNGPFESPPVSLDRRAAAGTDEQIRSGGRIEVGVGDWIWTWAQGKRTGTLDGTSLAVDPWRGPTTRTHGRQWHQGTRRSPSPSQRTASASSSDRDRSRPLTYPVRSNQLLPRRVGPRRRGGRRLGRSRESGRRRCEASALPIPARCRMLRSTATSLANRRAADQRPRR